MKKHREIMCIILKACRLFKEMLTDVRFFQVLLTKVQGKLRTILN